MQLANFGLENKTADCESMRNLKQCCELSLAVYIFSSSSHCLQIQLLSSKMLPSWTSEHLFHYSTGKAPIPSTFAIGMFCLTSTRFAREIEIKKRRLIEQIDDKKSFELREILIDQRHVLNTVRDAKVDQKDV